MPLICSFVHTFVNEKRGGDSRTGWEAGNTEGYPFEIDASSLKALTSDGRQGHDRPREKVGQAFGRLDDTTLVGVNRGLAVFLGFA
jgi:hypothetical protein